MFKRLTSSLAVYWLFLISIWFQFSAFEVYKENVVLRCQQKYIIEFNACILFNADGYQQKVAKWKPFICVVKQFQIWPQKNVWVLRYKIYEPKKLNEKNCFKSKTHIWNGSKV